MRKIMLLLIPMLVIALLLTGFSRNMEMSFDGDIEYTSQHGNNLAESVVEITGSGSGELTQEVSSGENVFSHDATVDFESVETTVGLKTPQGIYVTKIEPEPGESGFIEQYAEVKNDEFAQLVYGLESAVSYGLYQRYIDMKNQEAYVKEVLEVFGMGWTKDYLSFGFEEEE